MQIIKTIGNKQLLEREKTLFLCSKHTPINLYEHIFSWTDSLTYRNCIACFNSTEMEAEVLKTLLVAGIPTILFVMNRFTDVNNIQIEKALEEQRMLIVVLRRDEPKGKGASPRLRNEYVLSKVQHIVCGYINKNGSVFPLLAGRNNIEFLIDEEAIFSIAAEPEKRYERWTVAQDKVLLRMFYADMGIHAIHKKLHRTYLSIYNRIHSITQSEEVLKGRLFEDFVLSMFNFNDKALVLQEWQSDKSLGSLHPENNSNPDFVFRYEKRQFAIECKWRTSLGRDNSKKLLSEKNIDNYNKFAKERKMPVTIVLGIGGEPSNPDSLYIVPLEMISQVISAPSSVARFQTYSTSFDIFQFIDLKKKTKEKRLSIEKKRKVFLNAYKKWTQDEDYQLIALYQQGFSIFNLMIEFKRNEGAIKSRIKKLLQK